MIWRGALAGFLGGVLAAGAMSLGHKVVSAVVESRSEKKPPADEGDDATVKTAAAILRRPIPDDKKALAGNLVHYAFGGSVGAVYGAVAELAPRVTLGFGVPFGVAVWLGAHTITVPALGLAEPPTRRPLSKEGPEFVMHLVYGLVTEAARRLLRGVRSAR